MAEIAEIVQWLVYLHLLKLPKFLKSRHKFCFLEQIVQVKLEAVVAVEASHY